MRRRRASGPIGTSLLLTTALPWPYIRWYIARDTLIAPLSLPLSAESGAAADGRRICPPPRPVLSKPPLNPPPVGRSVRHALLALQLLWFVRPVQIGRAHV